MKKVNLISALLILLAALSLVGCASTEATAAAKAEVVGTPLVAEYSLVGYSFGFVSTGNNVEFKFLDVASDEEVAALANALMAALPGAESYSVPVGGTISIAVKDSLTAEQFNSFVEAAKSVLYNGIYR